MDSVRGRLSRLVDSRGKCCEGIPVKQVNKQTQMPQKRGEKRKTEEVYETPMETAARRGQNQSHRYLRRR